MNATNNNTNNEGTEKMKKTKRADDLDPGDRFETTAGIATVHEAELVYVYGEGYNRVKVTLKPGIGKYAISYRRNRELVIIEEGN